MMASETVQEDRGTGNECRARGATVVWRHRAVLISVGADAVFGCTGIERVSRIPGSQRRVRGVIAFMGEIVPVLSLFGEFGKRSPQRQKTEEYAVILSFNGVKFAVPANEVPRFAGESQLLDTGRNKLCSLRRKHLERLFQLCLSEGDQSRTGGKETESVEKERVSANADGVDKEIPEDSQDIELETTSGAPDVRCAVEEGVRWKRH